MIETDTVLCRVCYGVEETAFVIGTAVLCEVVSDAEEIVLLEYGLL